LCPSIPNLFQRPGTVWGLRQQPGLWNPGVWSHGGYWTNTEFLFGEDVPMILWSPSFGESNR
jgi:hypothetical protein